MATQTLPLESSAAAASRPINGAQIVLESLIAEGVDTIFGYPGGANLPLYQHLPEYPQLKHVLVRHEQGGAHAADGYARSNPGKVGVVWATSGPGALNLVTGLATAMLDSVPVVAFTGQVATTAIGTDAFQECDVIGSTLSVVKHSFLVLDIEDLAGTIHKAFHIARSGRPGPVLIDLPKDIQAKQTTSSPYPSARPRLRSYEPPKAGSTDDIVRVAELIAAAKRPVMLIGRGVLISQAEHEVVALAERCGIPTGWTLLGTGAFPARHPMALQMVGFMGAGFTNRAVSEADLVIMIGMRCDDRVTTKLDSFAPSAENIVHIDIDPAEVGKNVVPHVSVIGDAKTILADLNERVAAKREDAWLARVDEWRQAHPIRYRNDNGLLQPQDVLVEMYSRCENEAIVVADVGQNQIWAALWFAYDKPGYFLNSGGTGCMGFALPASMGAKFSNPRKRVFCVTGEGGFVMNMQELATMAEHNVDVTVVVLNNYSLGMVRQFQDDYYGGVRNAVDLTCTPNIVKLGEAFGIKAMSTDKAEEVAALFDAALAHDGPVLLNFDIDPEANVRPIVPLGKGLLDFVEEKM